MYKYEDPLDKGYTKFKLTKKQHNSLFKNRQIIWKNKYEYFIKDTDILMYSLPSNLLIVLATLAYPFVLLIMGVFNFKEINSEYYGLYNPKKTGAFSSDQIWKSRGSTYNEIKEILK